jgi:hypothetical protein
MRFVSVSADGSVRLWCLHTASAAGGVSVVVGGEVSRCRRKGVRRVKEISRRRLEISRKGLGGKDGKEDVEKWQLSRLSSSTMFFHLFVLDCLLNRVCQRVLTNNSSQQLIYVSCCCYLLLTAPPSWVCLRCNWSRRPPSPCQSPHQSRPIKCVN